MQLPHSQGNLFQQFYNTVDSIVVGNYIGANALASVGASTPIVNLMGAKTCLVIALAVTLTLSGGLYLFGEKLLRVFSSDQQVLSMRCR